MDSETAVPEQRVSVERRQQDVVCISCPTCSGAVPVLAQCIDGDVEPVLVCPDCGWRRPARRDGIRST